MNHLLPGDRIVLFPFHPIFPNTYYMSMLTEWKSENPVGLEYSESWLIYPLSVMPNF